MWVKEPVQGLEKPAPAHQHDRGRPGRVQRITFRRNRCPHCRGKLEPGQRIHPDCIDGYAEAQAAKAERAEEKKARAAGKVERAETRRRNEEARPCRSS